MTKASGITTSVTVDDAAGAGKDLTAQKQTVAVPDNALRAAINAALGHGAGHWWHHGKLCRQINGDDESVLRSFFRFGD